MTGSRIDSKSGIEIAAGSQKDHCAANRRRPFPPDGTAACITRVIGFTRFFRCAQVRCASANVRSVQLISACQIIVGRSRSDRQPDEPSGCAFAVNGDLVSCAARSLENEPAGRGTVASRAAIVVARNGR